MIDEDPGLAFRRIGLKPPARRARPPSPGTRCAPPAPCTCCSRRTGSRGSCRGSPPSTASARTTTVRKRPYELTNVFGVGFQIADTIARAAGVPRDSPGRRRAAVVHVLIEAERDGSTCLPVPELATQGRHAARRPAARRPAPARHGRARRPRARGPSDDVLWAYRPPTWRPGGRARAISSTGSPSRAPSLKPAVVATDDLTPGARAGGGRARPRSRSRVSIVTGGPGTGKTATIRLICAAAKAQKASIALVAPTGRAARRMAESTGMEASTIHSALGWIPGQGPTRDEIEADLLVVDETSMANLELLVTLLRAVGRGHARRARRRRGPARAGRRGQAVRGARGHEGRARRRAHAHLPPGGGLDDRPRRARRPPGRDARLRPARGPAARPVPDRARGPDAGAGRDRVAGVAPAAGALRRGPVDRRAGVRARLPRRARHRGDQHAPAPGAERRAGSR